MLFCVEVSVFRKKSLIKDGMYGAENDIFLYMVYEAVSIVLILNEYHQFRVWYEFVGTNFNREKHIGFTAKDIEVQCFGFVPQEDFLKFSPLETSNRCVIIYMHYSYNCEFPLGIG